MSSPPKRSSVSHPTRAVSLFSLTPRQQVPKSSNTTWSLMTTAQSFNLYSTATGRMPTHTYALWSGASLSCLHENPKPSWSGVTGRNNPCSNPACSAKASQFSRQRARCSRSFGSMQTMRIITCSCVCCACACVAVTRPTAPPRVVATTAASAIRGTVVTEKNHANGTRSIRCRAFGWNDRPGGCPASESVSSRHVVLDWSIERDDHQNVTEYRIDIQFHAQHSASTFIRARSSQDRVVAGQD